MKTPYFLAAGLAVSALLVGCSTPLPPGAEPGPHHTMAYDVLVEASEPGARIEAEGNHVGNTPVHIKIFGDPDGTFHDFGSYTYVIRAFPLASNQYPQIRVFGTGKGFQHEDRIPQRVYFDMNQPPPSYPTGTPPPYGYGYDYGYPYYYGYYGYPYWGWGGPYFYYGRGYYGRGYYGGGRYYRR